MLAGSVGAISERIPEPAKIRRQLARILSSAHFEASARRKRFLEFLVEETLGGRGDRLKGFTIALEVFGRDANFDSQNDPIVRLEAMRLRRDLEHYYLSAGQHDPVRISIPKGSYLPEFVGVTAAPVTAPATPSEPVAGAPTPVTPSVQSASKPRLVAWAAGLVAAAAVVVAVGVTLIRTDTTNEPVSAASPSIPTLIVTTFENVGEDPAQNFFAIGITEQIVADLTLFQGLRVIWAKVNPSDKRGGEASTGSTPKFVLSGSVRSMGSSIRVTARLLDTRSGSHIWARTFDRELKPSEVFAVQDEISQQVAATIGNDQGIVAQAGRAIAQRKPPESLSAYECVLRAHNFQRSGMAVAEFGSIRSCLENAVRIEPSYSDAWAMLSLIYGMEHRFGFDARPWLYNAAQKATETAQTAIDLNPRSPMAFMMLAVAYFDANDVTRYQNAADRALQLNPNDPILLVHVGSRFSYMGDWERGLPLIRKAVTLSSDQLITVQFVYALYYYQTRDYERAVVEAKKIDSPTFFWTYLIRSMTLGQLSRTDEAKVELARLLELKPDIRSQFKNFVKPWNMPGDHVAHMAEGLRKAGLQVELDRPAQAQGN